MRSFEVQTVTNGDMSLASINSFGLDVNQVFSLAIQAVFTGSPVGTLKLQISNDNVPVTAASGVDPAALVVNWSDYTGSSQAIAAAGNFAWNVSQPGYRWIRLVYTKGSGTGALNVIFNGKGV